MVGCCFDVMARYMCYCVCVNNLILPITCSNSLADTVKTLISLTFKIYTCIYNFDLSKASMRFNETQFLPYQADIPVVLHMLLVLDKR